jgi:hypothetical protein
MSSQMLSLRTGFRNGPSLPLPPFGASSFRGSLSHSGGSKFLSASRVVQTEAHPLPFAPARNNEELNQMRNASAFCHEGFAPGVISGKSRQSEWRS